MCWYQFNRYDATSHAIFLGNVLSVSQLDDLIMQFLDISPDTLCNHHAVIKGRNNFLNVPDLAWDSLRLMFVDQDKFFICLEL